MKTFYFPAFKNGGSPSLHLCVPAAHRLLCIWHIEMALITSAVNPGDYSCAQHYCHSGGAERHRQRFLQGSDADYQSPGVRLTPPRSSPLTLTPPCSADVEALIGRKLGQHVSAPAALVLGQEQSPQGLQEAGGKASRPGPAEQSSSGHDIS